MGSADRPWRAQGSITSGPPITGHEVLDNPELLKLAKKYGKTSANVVLRWHAQMGGSMVCKSVTPSRVEENFKIWDFALSKDDMKVNIPNFIFNVRSETIIWILLMVIIKTIFI